MANLPFSYLFPEDGFAFWYQPKIHLELNLTNDMTDQAELYKCGTKPCVAPLVRLMLSELQTDAVEKGQEKPTANQWLPLGRSWEERRWTKRAGLCVKTFLVRMYSRVTFAIKKHPLFT